jgi:8-oxo-dGTP pyrophosphatase MutT (NUDIX family)
MSGEENGEEDTPDRRRRRRKRRTPASDPAPATQPPAAPKTGSTTGKTGKAGTGGKAKRAGSRAKRTATPKGPVLKEVSAGGVVYRRDGDEIEVILASRRTRRGELAWGLAKGGIEEGESLEEAAAREVTEETGIVAEIEGSLGDTRYFYVWEDARIRKTVHFFLMRATGGDTADRDDEMEEVRWFPLERAMKRAAYRGEREVLGRAAELLR